MHSPPNVPPASTPTPSRQQRPQSFGWLSAVPGIVGSGKRGAGPSIVIGDDSPVGRRLFEARRFLSGDQGRSRGAHIEDWYK
jgi:hypothetical protein